MGSVAAIVAGDGIATIDSILWSDDEVVMALPAVSICRGDLSLSVAVHPQLGVAVADWQLGAWFMALFLTKMSGFVGCEPISCRLLIA